MTFESAALLLTLCSQTELERLNLNRSTVVLSTTFPLYRIAGTLTLATRKVGPRRAKNSDSYAIGISARER